MNIPRQEFACHDSICWTVHIFIPVGMVYSRELSNMHPVKIFAQLNRLVSQPAFPGKIHRNGTVLHENFPGGMNKPSSSNKGLQQLLRIERKRRKWTQVNSYHPTIHRNWIEKRFIRPLAQMSKLLEQPFPDTDFVCYSMFRSQCSLVDEFIKVRDLPLRIAMIV